MAPFGSTGGRRGWRRSTVGAPSCALARPGGGAPGWAGPTAAQPGRTHPSRRPLVRFTVALADSLQVLFPMAAGP